MTQTETDIAALAARIAAEHEARVARIAATDYDRTVALRKGYNEVYISVRPAEGNVSWQVEGVGIENTAQGGRVGDTRSRYFGELDGPDGAKAYANRWVTDLRAKGYAIIRGGN